MIHEAKIYDLMIVAPTSFFYQAPIYRELSVNPRLRLQVCFCSKESLTGKDVLLKFDTDSRWEESNRTLTGYRYKFVRNYSPNPSYLNWPFGLMNFGIWQEIKRTRPDAVVIMSWVNVTDLISICASLLFSAKLLIMTDANIQAEVDKPKGVHWLKKLILGKCIFPIASGFLYTGTANRRLYQHYGVPDEKLARFAFSWESNDFLMKARDYKSRRSEFRRDLGIPEDSFVILYCGRLSNEKAPMDLLKGYQQMRSNDTQLIFVGDGKLKADLVVYADQTELESVRFMGFQNRDDVSKFYTVSDVLVLPSLQEATGAVVTEAMCFGMPVITSDRVGFGIDLVEHGVNGFIFPAGDTESLGVYLERLANMSLDDRRKMGESSLMKIEEWSKFDLGNSLVEYLDNI